MYLYPPISRDDYIYCIEPFFLSHSSPFISILMSALLDWNEHKLKCGKEKPQIQFDDDDDEDLKDDYRESAADMNHAHGGVEHNAGSDCRHSHSHSHGHSHDHSHGHSHGRK